MLLHLCCIKGITFSCTIMNVHFYIIVCRSSAWFHTEDWDPSDVYDNRPGTSPETTIIETSNTIVLLRYCSNAAFEESEPKPR